MIRITMYREILMIYLETSFVSYVIGLKLAKGNIFGTCLLYCMHLFRNYIRIIVNNVS